ASPAKGEDATTRPPTPHTPTESQNRCVSDRRREEEQVAFRRITIFDTTLRDGEQSPGIALQPDEKAEIAEQLERLGVDVIEAGFAASSPGDFAGVEAVSEAVTRATVASLCRTTRAHVDAPADALRGAHPPRLPLLIPTSPHTPGREAAPTPAEGFRL